MKQEYEKYEELRDKEENKIIECNLSGESLNIRDINLSLDDPILFMQIPVNFDYLIQNEKSTFIHWRNETRKAFNYYFERGYKVVDFILEKSTNGLEGFHVLQKRI
jgi:predicted GNAT superfamily acetyltransferase